ncbi:hypothetical protein OE88DRAFT_1614720, partial [Heliocybe sulcata]
THVDFTDSSFFAKYAALPSIAQVRAEAIRQSPDGIFCPLEHRPPPVFFPDMRLIVKYGAYNTSIAEGQCLWMIHHYLKGAVPVPELYGWRHEGKAVFLYMELVQGVTLKDCWDDLCDADKTSICHDLRAAMQGLRSLRQNPSDTFIGHVGRQRLRDTFFESRGAGPFSSVFDLHEFFAFYPHPHDPFPEDPDPVREKLPDDARIVFIHGDLDKTNIIVSPPAHDGQPSRLVCIIDWHQSGWYPDYWEYCKARRLTVGPPGYEEEWGDRLLPTFLDVFENFH